MTSLLFEIQEKIAELQTIILDKHPKLPNLLKEIHTTLAQYPENVLLLSEEQIAVIVNGLEHQTNTFLATSVVKSSKSSTSTAKLKALGASAF
jgi:hypothetical protein